MGPLAGFREIEHTADWELYVWAPDLPGLLEQSARGMYCLSGIRLLPAPRSTRALDLPASDPERMLVAFLTELLWLSEQEGLGFDEYELKINGDRLHAVLGGGPISSQAKEIKAVTFHKLVIRQTGRGKAASIVFDV